MSKSELTKSVMNKIVNLEKTRTRSWLAKFTLIVIAFLTVTILFIWLAWETIVDRGTLDLLQLFGQDREIIADYWKDTVWVFWEELPQREILILLLLAAVAIIFVFSRRKVLSTVHRKINQIAAYQKK